MAIAPAPSPVTTPEGKAHRTAAFLDAHNRRMEQQAGLLRWVCRQCGSLIGKYRPPIGRFEEPCRKCRTYNELTTEPVAVP